MQSEGELSCDIFEQTKTRPSGFRRRAGRTLGLTLAQTRTTVDDSGIVLRDRRMAERIHEISEGDASRLTGESRQRSRRLMSLAPGAEPPFNGK